MLKYGTECKDMDTTICHNCGECRSKKGIQITKEGLNEYL